MIRIGSDTDVGMNRNSSDWLGMNSYPILSPGKPTKFALKLPIQTLFNLKLNKNLMRLNNDVTSRHFNV